MLPIGGLKEKAVAAHRNRVYQVIIPQQNVRDLDDMPDEIKEGVTFHPVESMDDVLTLALRETLPRPQQDGDQPYISATTH